MDNTSVFGRVMQIGEFTVTEEEKNVIKRA